MYVCMYVCMSLCVCVWAMLPDSNKMMMMMLKTALRSWRAVRILSPNCVKKCYVTAGAHHLQTEIIGCFQTQ